MIIQPNRLLYVAESKGRGRGVFTKEVIPKGDVIEVCPVVIFSEGYLKLLGQTELKDYNAVSPLPLALLPLLLVMMVLPAYEAVLAVSARCAARQGQ